MAKFNKEGTRLLINADEEWRTAYVTEAFRNWVTIRMISSQWTIEINPQTYEERFRNERNNSLYVIEDLFYKIART